jgi:hypothetical protein
MRVVFYLSAFRLAVFKVFCFLNGSLAAPLTTHSSSHEYAQIQFIAYEAITLKAGWDIQPRL